VILNTYHCILACDTALFGIYIQIFWRPSVFTTLSLLLCRLWARSGLEGKEGLFWGPPKLETNAYHGIFLRN